MLQQTVSQCCTGCQCVYAQPMCVRARPTTNLLLLMLQLLLLTQQRLTSLMRAGIACAAKRLRRSADCRSGSCSTRAAAAVHVHAAAVATGGAVAAPEDAIVTDSDGKAVVTVRAIATLWAHEAMRAN